MFTEEYIENWQKEARDSGYCSEDYIKFMSSLMRGEHLNEDFLKDAT